MVAARLAAAGIGEGEGFGVEHQPGVTRGIGMVEAVALNRVAKCLQVNAQLV